MTQADSCSILIADDDRALCTSLRDILELKEHRVELVHTGAAALDACSEKTYDVLLLDISLPDLSGVELISRVEEIRPELDILIITGHASVDTAVQAVSRSTIGYLVKPLDPDRLLAILDGIAQRKRVAEENRRLAESVEREKRQWQSTFHAISDPIVIVGADGSILRVNRSFCERFGTTLEAAPGARAAELVFGVSGTAAAGDPIASLSRLEERDDLAVPGTFEVSCDPVDFGSERGLICVLRDVSERERLVRQLEENRRTAVEPVEAGEGPDPEVSGPVLVDRPDPVAR